MIVISPFIQLVSGNRVLRGNRFNQTHGTCSLRKAWKASRACSTLPHSCSKEARSLSHSSLLDIVLKEKDIGKPLSRALTFYFQKIKKLIISAIYQSNIFIFSLNPSLVKTGVYIFLFDPPPQKNKKNMSK